MLIEDGTGSGKKARVNTRNHLVTTSVAVADSVFVALEDALSFSLDTSLLTIPAGFSGPIMMLQNLDSARDIIVQRAGITIDLPSTGATFSVYRNPSVGTLGANTPKKSLNVNFESGVRANVIAEIWDGSGVAGITGITPVTDGEFGPLPIPASGRSAGGPGTLGQNNTVTVNVASGAAGFECTGVISFYFDTTGVK